MCAARNQPTNYYISSLSALVCNCNFLQGPTRRMIKKPMVAAISGYAVAGGMELALMCDLRVMEETAVMGVFCRRFGENISAISM